MKLFFTLLLFPILSWGSCPNWQPDEAKKQILTLQSEITHHDELYYTKNTPILSDSEYDDLKDKLNSLENCFPRAVSGRQSVLQSSDIDVEHKFFMGSLKKARDARDILHFLKQFKKSEILIQPKIDGIAAELVYRQGKLVLASTRGTGDKGKNILGSVQLMPSIPKSINTQHQEIVLHGELFARLEKDNDYSGYSSARHYVAGQLNRAEPDPLGLTTIEFFPWRWVNSPFDTESASVNTLYNFGFELPTMYTESVKSLKDIERIRTLYQNNASKKPFLMDGIVIKLDSLDTRDRSGWAGTNPVWAIAWKFPPESVVTEVKGIDFRIGRTGHITPVLQLAAVELKGESIQQVSIGTINRLQQLDIAVGDQVSVVLKGAATPVFSKVVFRPENRTKPSLPDVSRFNSFTCLSYSPECKQQFIARLYWFITQLDIPELTKPRLEILIQTGKLATLTDLLKLSEPSLLKTGASVLTAQNIIKSLNALPKQPFAQQLRALSLPDIGKSRSEKVSKYFQNWQAFIEASPQEISSVFKLSANQVKKLKAFLNLDDVKSLVRLLEEGSHTDE